MIEELWKGELSPSVRTHAARVRGALEGRRAICQDCGHKVTIAPDQDPLSIYCRDHEESDA